MDNDDDNTPRYVAIDYRDLSPEALRGLIEEVITREGTDYGLEEVGLATKINDVERQLEAGEARIVFDNVEERPNIAPSR